MSLHSPMLFAEMPPAGFDGVFHWDWVSSAMKRATGRNIQPMDIDANVEVNGHFLIFETKRPGMKIPPGQARALLNLWARGWVTLVFLWGKEQPIHAEIFYPSGRKGSIRQRLKAANQGTGATVDHDWMRADFELFVENWARWAEKDACPFAYNGDVGAA